MRFDPRYFDRAVLWRYRAGWAGLTTTRSTPATYRDRGGIVRTAAPGVLRLDWQDGRPYTLVEPEGENLAHYSEPSVADLATTAGDVTDAPGFAGLARSLHVARPSSTSSSWAYIAYGGHAAGPLCFSAYVVMDDGGPPSLGTSGGADMRFFWGGSGADIAQHVEPLGGGVYLVWGVRESAESTGGNGGLRKDETHTTRGFRVAGYAVEHGVERPSSLIRTDGAPATRDRDLVTTDYAHPPGSCAVYMAGISAGGDQGMIGTAGARLLQIGSGTSVATRSLILRARPLSDGVLATIGSGQDSASSSAPAIPVGAEYQRLVLLDVDEATAQARVRLLQRHREPGGAWVDADGGWSSPLDVSELLAAGWESPHLTIGNVREGTRAGRLQLSDMLVLDGREVSVSALTWDSMREWLP